MSYEEFRRVRQKEIHVICEGGYMSYEEEDTYEEIRRVRQKETHTHTYTHRHRHRHRHRHTCAGLV
jgi:hypothetical protein